MRALKQLVRTGHVINAVTADRRAFARALLFALSRCGIGREALAPHGKSDYVECDGRGGNPAPIGTIVMTANRAATLARNGSRCHHGIKHRFRIYIRDSGSGTLSPFQAPFWQYC